MSRFPLITLALLLAGCGATPQAALPVPASALEAEAKKPPLDAAQEQARQSVLKAFDGCTSCGLDANTTRMTRFEIEPEPTLVAVPASPGWAAKTRAYRFNVTVEYTNKATGKAFTRTSAGVYDPAKDRFYFPVDAATHTAEPPFHLAKPSAWKAAG